MLLMVAVERCASFTPTLPPMWSNSLWMRRDAIILRVSSEQQQQQKAVEASRVCSSSGSHALVGVVVEVTMKDHRPLGCTVEESLAEAGTVFVASVKAGGNAGAAGLLPGDVIAGVMGLFGDVEDVSGLGIEKV